MCGKEGSPGNLFRAKIPMLPDRLIKDIQPRVRSLLVMNDLHPLPWCLLDLSTIFRYNTFGSAKQTRKLIPIIAFRCRAHFGGHLLTRCMSPIVSPGLLVLGISLSLAGVNLNLPSFISLEVLSNHSLFILSSVSVVAPRVMFPGLLFIKE